MVLKDNPALGCFLAPHKTLVKLKWVAYFIEQKEKLIDFNERDYGNY